MKFFFKQNFFFLVLLFSFFPIISLAGVQLELTYPTLPGVQMPTAGTTAQDLAIYIQYIFYFAIFLGIILALLILVFAGFRYLYSAGNPQIQAKSKDQIKSSFLGLILLLASLTFLNSIFPEFSQIEPAQLTRQRLIINLLRRVRIALPWQQIVSLLEPPTLPLEVSYLTAEGFAPSFIPFSTQVAPSLYPLHQLVARYVKYLYDLSVMVVAIIALVFVIIGGVKYMTARGNIGQVKDAKDQIFSALLGLLLLLGSYLILRHLRPEYTILQPAELPETEIELEPGIYVCATTMNNDPDHPDTDLLACAFRCRDRKRWAALYNSPWPPASGGNPCQSCLFTKRQQKEIMSFVNNECILLQHSESLPAWSIGEPVDISKIREEIENAPLTDEEKQEIIESWEEYNLHHGLIPGERYIYINGDYGVILHRERDFKGVAEIRFKNEITSESAFPPEFHGGNIQNVLDHYMYRFSISEQWASFTIFLDEVTRCAFETPENPGNEVVNLSDCLNIHTEDDITFSLFNIPDFGALEEKREERKSFHFLWFPQHSFTVVLEPIRNHGGSPAGETFNFQQDPAYSLKLPAEEKWILAVAASPGSDMAIDPTSFPVYVLNKSVRNLEATYVRSFCPNYPCVTHFFAWPGKILRKLE